MIHRESSHQDLEAFQRWAIAVDDQLREAVDAMMAIEDPNAGELTDARNLLHSDRSSADLADNLVDEINRWKENPKRPAWFTPAFQMVLRVSTWAEFLMDYIDEVTRDGA